MLKYEEIELFKALTKFYNNHRGKNDFDIKKTKSLFCWEELIAHEIWCAKQEGFIVLPEIENQDDLLNSLERLFCSGNSYDFTLAKQLFSSLVFTEEALKKTLLNIYRNFYLSNSRTTQSVFWHFQGIMVEIHRLSIMSKDISTNEEELASLTDMIKLKRQELIASSLLPIFPTRADFSAWNYYYFNTSPTW